MYVKRVLFVKRGYCGASLYKYLLSTPCPPPPQKKKIKKIIACCLGKLLLMLVTRSSLPGLPTPYFNNLYFVSPKVAWRQLTSN